MDGRLLAHLWCKNGGLSVILHPLICHYFIKIDSAYLSCFRNAWVGDEKWLTSYHGAGSTNLVSFKHVNLFADEVNTRIVDLYVKRYEGLHRWL